MLCRKRQSDLGADSDLRSGSVELKLAFGPQELFTMPTLQINGVERPELVSFTKEKFFKNRKKFVVAVSIPSDKLDCLHWNDIDLIFHASGGELDRVSILEGPLPSFSPIL